MKQLTRAQWMMLIILALINFFNYVDRQVIFPLFGHIKADFHLSDFQLGLLGTVFMVVHSLASVPLGVIADKGKRKLVIFWSVLFWSVMSFSSGLVRSFRGLLGIRSLVGIGEAGYAPAAVAMISDNFPQSIRARVHGVFNVGMMTGGTLGAIMGGIIAFYFGNWRIALFLVSLPGFVLAFSSLWLRDIQVPHPKHYQSRFTILFKNPAYVWILISTTFSAFAAGGYIAWGVEFVRRYKGFNLRDASIVLGSSLMIAGTVGVLVGSWLADRWQTKAPWGRSLVIALSSILSAPFIFLGLRGEIHGSWFVLYFFIGTCLLACYNGPLNAVMHDILPKHVRSTAFAVYLLVIHLIGEATSPAIIGRISDTHGLQAGMQFLTFVALLGGLTFIPVVLLIKSKRVPLFIDDEAAEILP